MIYATVRIIDNKILGFSIRGVVPAEGEYVVQDKDLTMKDIGNFNDWEIVNGKIARKGG